MPLSFTYLDHSGFLVETDRFYLVFDYYTDTPKQGRRADGVIRPEEIADKQAVVFSSHRHDDHFNPVVLSWGRQISGIQYVFSDDITALSGALYVGPDQCYSVAGLSFRTFRSTDEGVAFLVEADGYRIYHAGDLNWWHWEGEEEDYNRDMAECYQWEIAKMSGEAIDLAFVPVDLRLGKRAYLFGLDYLMRSVMVKAVVPMHFWKDFSVVFMMQRDGRTLPYRDKIIPIVRRGQTVTVI